MEHKNLISRPVTERIKTFEDACRELGDNHPFVLQYNTLRDNGANGVDCADVAAYLKLRIVCAALNEGWEPQFTEDEDGLEPHFTEVEERWYPWHWLYTQGELDNMADDEKQNRAIISTEDYKTDYRGFGFAHSSSAPSFTGAAVGSLLCFRSGELSAYAGRQFIELYADFNLIRK